MPDALEPLRRIIKFVLFFVAARGSVERYMRLRSRIMLFMSRNGLYERRAMKNLRTFVKPGDTVVDAGAHFGGYTLALADIVGPSGKVLAFEPLPDVYKLLCEATAHLPQVTCINVALSDENRDSVPMYIPLLFGRIPEPALASLEIPDFRHRTLSVDVKTLDTFREHLRGLTFMKADIEGFELEFLLGAIETLRTVKPLIQCELSDSNAWNRIAEAMLRSGLSVRTDSSPHSLNRKNSSKSSRAHYFHII